MEQSKYEKIKINQYKTGWVECPRCHTSFHLEDRSSWSGLIHRACGQRLEVADHKEGFSFIWGIKANVVENSTSRFVSGSIVYLFPPLWGDGYQSIKVIGKDKETKKFIEVIVNEKVLTNFKTIKITKADLISRMNEYWKEGQDSKDFADELVLVAKRRQKGRIDSI